MLEKLDRSEGFELQQTILDHGGLVGQGLEVWTREEMGVEALPSWGEEKNYPGQS